VHDPACDDAFAKISRHTALACFTSNPRFFTGVGGRGGSP